MDKMTIQPKEEEGLIFFFLNHSQLPKSPSEEGVWATFAILLILADLV